MARTQTKTASGKKSSSKSTPSNKKSTTKTQSSNNTSTTEENTDPQQGNDQEGSKKEMGLLETVKDIFSPIKPVDKTLEELFEDGLKDMYSAEKQLVKALPKLAQAAYSDELSYSFMQHYSQTKKQAQTLERIMKYLKIDPNGKKCKAMEGLIAESDDMIRHYNESPVRDSALIIGAQKVEHYEIASYGSLCELADVLGFGKIKDALGAILEEEKHTDKLLTQLAMDANDESYEQAASKKAKGRK
jgi:ferritin-like metal-binding protein YciE